MILIFFSLLITFTETTFLKTDADFLEAVSIPYRQDGSTALAAVLIGDQLYVANVGDSRAIALKGGKGNIFLIFFAFLVNIHLSNIQYHEQLPMLNIP
jgi:serine/threonine protein phosphatase PrpC